VTGSAWSVRIEYELHGPLPREACRALGAAIAPAVRPAVVSGGDRLMVWMWRVVTAGDQRRAAGIAGDIVRHAAAAAGVDVMGDPLPALVTPVLPSRRGLG